MPNLTYAMQRKVDDFCSGKSLAGHGYWVRVLAEPTINDRHMTVVRAELAYGEAGSLVTIGEHVMTVYPNTLDEFDTYLQGGFDPNEWVHVEAAWQEYGSPDKEGNRRKSKKYKVIQTVKKGLDAHTGPPKPAVVREVEPVTPLASIEWGQPGAGGEPATAGPQVDDQPTSARIAQQQEPQPPATPCPHTGGITIVKEGSNPFDWYMQCDDCGERVG